MANPFDEFDEVKGNPFDEFDEAPKGASSFGDTLKGLGEETLALGSQFALTPIAGLAGLSTTIMKGPQAGAKMVEDVMGMGYQPKTQRGQELTERAGQVLNIPVEYGEKAGGAIGGVFGPKGENVGRFLGNVAGNFASDIFPVVPGVVAGKVQPKGKAKPKSKLEALEELSQPKEMGIGPIPPEAQMELPLTSDISQSPVSQSIRAAAPQGELFGTPKDLTPSARPAQPPLETVAQHNLFDQSEMGRVANPFEAATGDWRVDENGIPIKADLSMELQNLENPLQRNLWGDELQPTRPPEGMGLQGVITDQPQGGIPLTEAIDSMPWAQRRGAINQELKGEVQPSGELHSAMIEATPGRVIPKSQRGAVNPEVFDEAFQKIKELPNGIRLWMMGTEQGPIIKALHPDGSEAGTVEFSGSNWGRELNPYNDNLYSMWTDTEGAPGKNLAAEMYKFAAEEGNDIKAAGVQTDAGRHMWEKFEKQGISKDQVIKAIPRSQRGAIDPSIFGEGLKKIMTLGKDSPEVKAAGVELRKAGTAKVLSKAIPGLDSYRPIFDTPESVISAAPDAKDITATQKFLGKTVKPGIRQMRNSTNNPLINFVGERTAKDFSYAENLDRQYITDKRTGIGRLYQSLNGTEVTEVHSAIRAGDRHQKQYTPEELRQAGFNEKQVEFMRKYYEMDAKWLDEYNEGRLATGQDPVKPRVGHAPGIFAGDYYSLVMDKDGGVLGYISGDTKFQFDKAVKNIQKNYPDAKITNMARKGLSGHGPRSEILNGQRDLLNLLAKNDPRLAEVQAMIDLTTAQNADSFSQHALQKKGVFGSEGMKPWKSDIDNARDFFKAYFQWWSEGVLSHKLMKTQAEVASLLRNPELDHMPRTKNYVEDYMRGMTGRTASKWGDGLNSIIDASAETIGVGPSVARETFNQANKRLGQQAMGWFNLPFMGLQFLQVVQTGWPEFIRTAQKIGSPLSVPDATTRAVGDMFSLVNEQLTGKQAKVGTRTREMMDYAKSRGLLTFSEFEDVNKVHQGKISRRYDAIADFTRQIGEEATRPYVFFTYVRMLDQSGLPKHEVFDTAYNLTQTAMYDYSARERPMMFRKLGVTGQMAGSLQTFSFNYLNQMARHISEAGKGNPVPLVASLAAVAAFAGVGGLPFYQEADELSKWATNKTIKDHTLPKSEKWAPYVDAIQYGLLSDYTGVNFQSRLGAADVLPNSLGEAITPYASTIGKIGSALGQVASENDPLAYKNLARAVAPSSLRGPIENMFMTEKAPSGVSYSTDQYGQTDYPRTSNEQTMRNWGVTSLEESKYKQNIFEGRGKLKSDKERQVAIERKIERALVQAAPISLTPEEARARIQKYTKSQDFKELVKEYVDRGGDPNTVDDAIVNAIAKGTRMTSKQRAEGILQNTLESIHRYKTFNP